MAAEKCAIFFPEGDGYLLCGSLGAGAEGATSIVRSIVNNQDYVRKKTKATSAKSSHKDGIYCAEVSLYRPHPRIPALVHSQDFKVLPQGHPRAEEFKATSMLFSYCNGGTLERFLTILERERILAPEVLVWHLLDNLLEAIEHLHRGASSVSHGDLHENNIYLHYPTPESRLPDFFIGDLGMARPVDQSVWEISGNPPARKLREMSVIKMEDEQAQREYQIMKDFGAAPQEQSPPPPPPLRTKQIEAMLDDLKSIHSCLFRLLQGRGQHPNNMRYAPFRDGSWVNSIMMTDPNDYNAFVGFRQAVSDLAQRARETADVLPDFQWTRQDRYRDDFPPGVSYIPPFPFTRYNHHLANHPALKARLAREWQYTPLPEIRLFQSRYHLLHLSANTPGPWKIARVDPGTFKVLAVEELSFGLHVPSLRENCPVTNSGRALNHDDLPMANQLVTTEVDRIGMANIVAAAMKNVSGHNQGRFFDVGPEWNEERLSKQGQLALRATAYVPPLEDPLPLTQGGPSAPRKTSPTSPEDALAVDQAFTAARTPPETQQASAALQQDPPAAQQTPPPASRPPSHPPQPQTPPAQRRASLTPQQGAPAARENSPASDPQTLPAPQPVATEPPAAAPETTQEEEQNQKVVKKTKAGRKEKKGRARGAAASASAATPRNPSARNHPATRRPRAEPAPPSRVTTRSMARKMAMEKIIWTRSKTRAAAAAAAAQRK